MAYVIKTCICLNLGLRVCKLSNRHGPEPINNQDGGGNTPKIEKKNLDAPDERRSFENGKIDVVTVGGITMGRMTFQPGWKWSKHVKPIVKTNSCQTHHVGIET